MSTMKTLKPRIAVMTSGGDAQGMNAAVRSVVRTALDMGADCFAIQDGYSGMVAGGDEIRPMHWGDVGGIIHRGGTVIGTARCLEFRARPGRLTAAKNLIQKDISRLVIIGGDGSLTGANTFKNEWPSLLEELVDTQQITLAQAAAHPDLHIVGLVGSIDNDMCGTDITIGADTALHRITEAIDAISSTAASHQRAFIVEVMGRNCGYLALMAGIATGADWVLIPENPPNGEDWEKRMCNIMLDGRKEGRRDSIVVLSEGAVDRQGREITASRLQGILESHMEEEVRITILGHVQRGGTPSAFDRNLSSQLGWYAAKYVIESQPGSESMMIGIENNRVIHKPLMQCVRMTHSCNDAIGNRDFRTALNIRGHNFKRNFRILRTLVRARPHEIPADHQPKTFAIMNCGGPAPGMNAGTRAAARLLLDQGHKVLGIQRGIKGLINDWIIELGWMDCNGWAPLGGSELGTSRRLPPEPEFYSIAQTIERYNIDGILIIGGISGYTVANMINSRRDHFPAFHIPMVCIPASIDNDLPDTELSVGTDTALNNIMNAVDKIKQSAVASNRAFVVEVMGRRCGYLATMGGLATGAERVYTHEEGVTIEDLSADVRDLTAAFKDGKKLGLLIRSEDAHPVYTTDFTRRLLEAESGDIFSVRQSVLGHIQQGGDPTPFDRIFATRLAAESIDKLQALVKDNRDDQLYIGLKNGELTFNPVEDFLRQMDQENARPREQWWLELMPIAQLLAKSEPTVDHAQSNVL